MLPAWPIRENIRTMNDTERLQLENLNLQNHIRNMERVNEAMVKKVDTFGQAVADMGEVLADLVDILNIGNRETTLEAARRVVRERDEARANAARWREEIELLKGECVDHIKFINYLLERLHGDY